MKDALLRTVKVTKVFYSDGEYGSPLLSSDLDVLPQAGPLPFELNIELVNSLITNDQIMSEETRHIVRVNIIKLHTMLERIHNSFVQKFVSVRRSRCPASRLGIVDMAIGNVRGED